MRNDKVIVPISDFAKPLVGKQVTDPDFNTPFTRLTDARRVDDMSIGNGKKLWGAQVEYATICPFSYDSQYLLILHASYFTLYRKQTSGTYAWYSDLIINGRFEVGASSSPRWDSNSLQFYYINGNTLKSFGVGATGTAIRQFPEYIIQDNKGVPGLRTLGEGDVITNQIALIGTLPNGTQEIFIYDINANKKSRGTLTNSPIDNIMVTPSGNCLADISGSIYLYASDMTLVGNVCPSGHKDVGRDSAGDECIVWVDAADVAENVKGWGITKIRLADGTRTRLVTIEQPGEPWLLSAHVYVPQIPGVALISTFTSSVSPINKPYNQEVFTVSMDGKATVQRFVHHRSFPGTYTHQPRATGNRDLSTVVYNSCWLDTGPNYTDVYMCNTSPTQMPTKNLTFTLQPNGMYQLVEG